MSSFNLQPGRVVRPAILANLVGDGSKQELLSAATLNSILDTAVQSSCKFLDMPQAYIICGKTKELKPSVSLVSRFSGFWIEDPHKSVWEQLEFVVAWKLTGFFSRNFEEA